MFHRESPGVPSGVEAAAGDLSDVASLRLAAEGCETVFHLAGKAHDLDGEDLPAAFRAVNVQGTASLLGAAKEARVSSFVFVSSVKAMGEGAEECLDEDSPAVPSTPYGRSKLEAERLVLDAGARSGMRVSILRLPLVYGPGLKGNLRLMLDAVARGIFPPLPHLRNHRSLASVEDVVSALQLAGRQPAAAGRLYLVTDGVDYTSRGIYDAMREALGKPPVSWSIPLPALRAAAALGDAAGRIRVRRPVFGRVALEKLLGTAWYRNDRIRRELGFEPATTLQAALPAIVRSRSHAP